MKTCEEILDLISLRLDGELAPEQVLELEEHLTSCPACKALADDLADIHSVMPGMNVQPPAFIMEHVMERIKGEGASVIPFPAKENNRPQWKAWAGIAAALVLVVSGAFALWGGNASKDNTPMTLDAGMPEASAAPSPYKAAIERAEGEAAIALPTPEPSAAPSSAPAETEEPAEEPAVQTPESRGEDKAVDNAEKPNTTTTFTAGTEPPQTRNFMGLPPQSESSAAPSTTPTPTPMPTPDNRQQTVGLQIAPAASPAPVTHLTVAGAAMKLYEEKYAAVWPEATFIQQDDFAGYMLADMVEDEDGRLYCLTLSYIKLNDDGYRFEEVYHMSDVDKESWNVSSTNQFAVPEDGNGEIISSDVGSAQRSYSKEEHMEKYPYLYTEK